jgi:menaquinone-dependent protoporphyrinogen IX oxidase
MHMIVGMAGGDTDPTRDYKYTDRDAVERFADAFAQRLNQAQEMPFVASR